eukprot:1369232-Amorphochlora_amoeboformis.AAC.1
MVSLRELYTTEFAHTNLMQPSKVPPFSTEVAKQIVEEELGNPNRSLHLTLTLTQNPSRNLT